MSDDTTQEKDPFKTEIQENLMKYQEKYKKILAAELRLAQQKPINYERLDKQKKARMILSKELERLSFYLIEMGDFFIARRKRGLTK